MQLPCNAVGVNDANHARYCTRPRIDGWANRSDGWTGQTRDVLGASERVSASLSPLSSFGGSSFSQFHGWPPRRAAAPSALFCIWMDWWPLFRSSQFILRGTKARVGSFSHDCDTRFSMPRDVNSCEIRHLHLTLEKWNVAVLQGASCVNLQL